MFSIAVWLIGNARGSQLITFSLLYDVDDVVSVKLFQAGDEQIYRQRGITGANDPVGQQHQTGIQLTAEFFYHTSLIAYNIMECC